MRETHCETGCTYSNTEMQAFPRTCLVCGWSEKKVPKPVITVVHEPDSGIHREPPPVRGHTIEPAPASVLVDEPIAPPIAAVEPSPAPAMEPFPLDPEPKVELKRDGPTPPRFNNKRRP